MRERSATRSTILRRVKGLQFLARGRARFHDAHALVEPARDELGEKRRVPVGPEWMAVAEAVTREAFAGDQQDRRASTVTLQRTVFSPRLIGSPKTRANVAQAT